MAERIPAILEEQTVTAENFSKQSLESRAFTDCTFTHCNFLEATLRNTKFSTCTFVSCNLSLVKVEGCRFQDVQFVDCKIVGAEFCKCERAFFSPTFTNCLLQYCNFSDLPMKNSSFKGSKIQESHFTNTTLTGADFNDVDLSATIFHNCDLSKADFSSATHYDIDPRTNKIKRAKFSLPEAVGLLRGFDITIVYAPSN